MTKVNGPDRLPIIEGPRVIWAVIPAISRSNATIVNLNVQSIIVVIGRVYGTNWLARRVFTVLAQYRNEASLDVRPLPFPIALNPYPFDRSTFGER
jgi:hypothetical protein